MKKALVLFLVLLPILIFSEEYDYEIFEQTDSLFVFDSSVSLEIVFPENSKLSIGTCPVLLDIEQVRYQSRVQAGVFASKLTGVLSMYELAVLNQIIGENISEQQMQIERNVMLSLDAMHENIRNLFLIDGVQRFSYFIGLYGLDEYATLPVFTAYNEAPYHNLEALEVFDTYIRSSGISNSYRLDVALDDAFSSALSEMSKYLVIEVKSMTKDSDFLQEKAMILSSNAELRNIQFSRILISRIEKDKVFSFRVIIQLKKDF